MIDIIILWGVMIGSTVANYSTLLSNITPVEQFSTQQIVHSGFSSEDQRQLMVQYAYEIGGIELVTLIECENALRDPYRKAGGKEDSWGFCMINRRWHKDIVDNPLFRNDWKWQIDQCNRLMVGGTKFYGRNRKINGIECGKYVLDRFIIG